MLSMIQINNFMSKIKVSTKLNFLRQRGQRIRSPGNLYRARFLMGRDGALVEAITLNRRALGQVLYLQLPVRFGVKLRYSIRAVAGSASEW